MWQQGGSIRSWCWNPGLLWARYDIDVIRPNLESNIYQSWCFLFFYFFLSLVRIPVAAIAIRMIMAIASAVVIMFVFVLI